MFIFQGQRAPVLWENPEKTWVLYSSREILTCLEEMQTWVDRGYTLTGWFSYEAAGGFDPGFYSPVQQEILGYWEAHRGPGKPLPQGFPGNSTALGLSPLECLTTRRDYEAILKRVKENLEEGNTYQVNLTLGFSTKILGDLTTAGLVDLWLRGWKDSPGPQGVFCAHPQGWILSFSPEVFFTARAGDPILVESRPMKGTRPRGSTPEEDRLLAEELVSSPKDRAENLMITDMIRNDLGQIAEPGTVVVPRLFDLETYPTVHQLVSTVQAQTRQSVPGILRSLFPCASITGAPKKRTMEIIRSLESRPRGIYTGTLGIWDQEGARFNVAIRTLSVDTQGRGTYGAGGGIVWDSRPDQEWEELHIKTRVLDPLVLGGNLLETLEWNRGFPRAQAHLERLTRSAEILRFPPVPQDLFDRFPGTDQPGPLRVRVEWTREAQEKWSWETLKPLDQPLILGISPERTDTRGLEFRYKTTDRRVYDRIRCSVPEAQEVLIVNTQGKITEGTFTNLIYDLEGQLWTPPVEDGLLNGVLRQEMINNKTLGIRSLEVQKLRDVRAFYMVNSLRGIMKAVLLHPGQ